MNQYPWILEWPVEKRPIQRSGRMLPPVRRTTKPILVCDGCRCEVVGPRKTCPACARRLRTDAA